MSELTIYVINTLLGLLLLVVGGYVKSMVARLSEMDAKHQFLETKQSDQYEKLRDRIENNLNDTYRHQDQESEKLRTDIGKMGDSLRNDISALNGVILKLISEIKKP